MGEGKRTADRSRQGPEAPGGQPEPARHGRRQHHEPGQERAERARHQEPGTTGGRGRRRPGADGERR